MDAFAKDWPVTVEFPVKWGEMDAYQHVNNTVYFRYFEDVRIAYFERVGLHELKRETQIGPILGSTRCRFRIPLTFPDTVLVGARVTELSNDRFKMAYGVYSRQHDAVAAEGEGLLVTFDYRAGKKAPVPARLREAIVALEGERLQVGS